VVQRERERLEQLQEQLSVIQNNLDNLSGTA
jgi:hypothetical protein